MPTDEELALLYEEDYFAYGMHGLEIAGLSYEDLADGRRDQQYRFLQEELLARQDGAESLFEIGAAMGHFLAVAREAGLRVGGVEISELAVDRARRKFDLNLHCGNIERLDAEMLGTSWDIVYAGDLFEHLRDPAGVLVKVNQMLRPGGMYAMRLPGTFNLVSTRLALPLLRLARHQIRLPDKPYHLYEYTTDSLRKMLGSRFARVEIVNEAIPPARLNLKDRSIAYLGKYMLQWINWPLTRLTGRYGDRMTVFAWKADA